MAEKEHWGDVIIADTEVREIRIVAIAATIVFVSFFSSLTYGCTVDEVAKLKVTADMQIKSECIRAHGSWTPVFVGGNDHYQMACLTNEAIMRIKPDIKPPTAN